MKHSVWVVALLALGTTLTALLDGTSVADDDGPRLRLDLVLARGANGRVSVDVVLTNEGNGPALLPEGAWVGPESGAHDLAFRVMGPGRHLLPERAAEEWDREGRAWHPLAPGSSRTFRVELSAWFDLSVPGFYDVQAIYDSAHDAPSASAWKGRVVSPLLRFRQEGR